MIIVLCRENNGAWAEGREPTIYDAIAQAIGSTAGFMIPGSAVSRQPGRSVRLMVRYKKVGLRQEPRGTFEGAVKAGGNSRGGEKRAM